MKNDICWCKNTSEYIRIHQEPQNTSSVPWGFKPLKRLSTSHNLRLRLVQLFVLNLVGLGFLFRFSNTALYITALVLLNYIPIDPESLCPLFMMIYTSHLLWLRFYLCDSNFQVPEISNSDFCPTIDDDCDLVCLSVYSIAFKTVITLPFAMLPTGPFTSHFHVLSPMTHYSISSCKPALYFYVLACFRLVSNFL